MKTAHTVLRASWSSVVQGILAVSVVTLGSWLAYKQMFTGVEAYDDEGGMLLTLLHYIKHGELYTATFALYGPFYFFAEHALHTMLHLPVTHDGSRILSLIFWLLTSLLSMLFIQRVTRSLPLACVCFLFTLFISRVLCFEPGHPQEIIVVLIQLSLLLSLLLQGDWSGYAWAAIGTIAALLCLTKINVGAFFSVAVLLSCSAVVLQGKAGRVAKAVIMGAAVVMPFGLMHAHMHAGSLHFCILATACIAMLCLTSWRLHLEKPLSIKVFIPLLLGGVLGGSAILLVANNHGVSFHALLNGIVLSPLRHPVVFMLVFWVSRTRLLLAALLFLATTGLWVFNGRHKLPLDLLGLIKCVLGISVLGVIWFDFPLSPPVVLPMLSILYLSPKGEKLCTEWLSPRLLLCFVIGVELLQIYPVAGSQVAIALTPCAAWACLIIFDGVALLAQKNGASESFAKLSTTSFLGLQTAVLVLMWCSDFRVKEFKPLLDLPGARRVHVSEQDLITYRTLTEEIRSNCDMLFTMPGMGSLNLWSDRPTPNGYNLTAWMSAFTEEQQRVIVDIMKRDNRPCIVYNADLLKDWFPEGVAKLTNSPLASYVFNETQAISTISGYELRLPTLRSPARAPGR